MKNATIGTKHKISDIVTESMLACNVGSGSLRVFATPAVLAMMEKAACELLEPYLDEGITTVGISADLSHLNPTPLGAAVTAEAELTEISDRKYTFTITVYDELGVIAAATHERFAVKADRFSEKAEARRK